MTFQFSARWDDGTLDKTWFYLIFLLEVMITVILEKNFFLYRCFRREICNNIILKELLPFSVNENGLIIFSVDFIIIGCSIIHRCVQLLKFFFPCNKLI